MLIPSWREGSPRGVEKPKFHPNVGGVGVGVGVGGGRSLFRHASVNRGVDEWLGHQQILGVARGERKVPVTG
jgi:hypothetical protein